MPSKAQTAAAETRIQQVRSAMKKHNVDGLVVNQASSIRYLTGFSGSAGLLIIGKRSLDFFTNDLYELQVQKELYQLKGLRIHVVRDFWKSVAEIQLGTKLSQVGFMPNATTVAALKTMKKRLGPAKLVEVKNLISPITQVKTKDEVKSIAKAAEITSVAYQMMLGIIEPGMTEHEVSTFLASTTRELGSERDAFDIIVVSGVRSAMPHGRPSQAVLQKGHVVTVDFGCCVNGLYSDMTRTFCIGTPTKKIVDVFAVLYDAHLTALDATVPGITGAELDSVARTVITNAGYGEFFRHSLGHGLGYEVHENPRIAAVNTDGIIAEGTVITIEPGIYLPGKFGMRIEDDVLVTKNGPKILTSAPRELVIV